MKQINTLLKQMIMISFAVSFLSFAISAIGAMVENSAMIMFWYLGLMGIAAILSTAFFAGIRMAVNLIRNRLHSRSCNPERDPECLQHAA